MKKYILSILICLFLFVNSASAYTNIIDNRIGGDDKNWAIIGNTVYHPAETLVQSGINNWSGKPTNIGQLFISYPQSYAGSPLVFTQVIGPTHTNLSYSVYPMYQGLIIYWQTTDNTNKNYIEFQWIAFGER